MATGTIMTAEASRAPTTRMDTETVSAATTATSTLRAPVGRPQAWANSSSWHNANSGPRSPSPTGSTRVARAMVNQASETETVETVAEPYLVREGLIGRTPRGRVALPAAWEHLGLEAPEIQL